MSAAFQIESGIPLPPKPRSGPKPGFKRHKYPFDKMSPGESFFVDCARSNRMRVQANLIGAAARHGGVWETRQAESGVRIWRVK